MTELDNNMEQQIQSIEGFRHQEGARLAEIINGRRDILCGKRSTSPKRIRLAEGSEEV